MHFISNDSHFDNCNGKVVTSTVLACLVIVLLSSFYLPAEKNNTSFEPVCRGAVNVTLNPNLCYAHIKVTGLLIGDFDESEYTLEIFDQSGSSMGDTIPGLYAGQTVNAVISHSLSNFSCSTEISVFDLNPPVLSLPEDVALACYENPEPANTGMATATDCTPVSVTYEDEWKETACGNPKIEILRIWRATDARGFIAIDTQYIDIMRATAQDILFPEDQEYSCTEYLSDPNLIDPFPHKAGQPTLVTNPRCGLIFTHQDQHLPICGNPETSFIILRRWTVLDACGNEVFLEDGAGNDNVQLIRVLDTTAPVIEPVIQNLKAALRQEDNGLSQCSSVGFIPPPNIIDECNEVSIRIFSTVGELDYVNGTDGSEGGYIPFPGLTLGGPHQIYYTATDACGNESNISAYFTVIDDQEPIMLCDKEVTVNLGLDGHARLEIFRVDEGIRDNCCLDEIKIKWVDDPIISFRDRIDIYCLNEPRKAVLRAWDCEGNFNDCETTVLTHDPLPASIAITPPPLMEVDCAGDRSIFNDPQYQAPLFQDNCPMDIRFSVRDSINECGTIDLWRQWTLQDHPDHQVLFVGQLIRFIDEEKPQIIISELGPVCDTDGDCRGDVELLFSAIDNCSDHLQITHQISLYGSPFQTDSLGQISQGPDGFALKGNYPIGEHMVVFTAIDPCGNEAEASIKFEVVDCLPPELSCIDETVFFIGEDQQVLLSPEDLVAEVSDACGIVDISFAGSAAENILYDCDSLGVRQLSVWATDSQNNRSKCTVNFTMLQQGRACEPTGILRGRVTNVVGEGVALVRLNLYGPDTLQAVTDPEGYYRFESVPLEVDYEMTPKKEINTSNGVTVLDILKISKHILGIEFMTSPYQIMAADVNKSGSITALDVITARRVILGLSEHFASHTSSWGFVSDDYVFLNPDHPLEERVPEKLNFQLTSEETVISFIGLKYGDVNGSADPGR